MPFFQNVFRSDFEGNWVLGDRHHSPKFVVPGNAGRGEELVVAWAEGPYDLSGVDADGTNTTDTLEIVYALREYKNWATLSIDIADGAAVASAVTADEIVANLNEDDTFAERFIAEVKYVVPTENRRYVQIRSRRPATEFRFYIENGRAEDILKFNMKAGVAEAPSYFARHTIANRFTYSDSQNALIELDPSTSDVHANIIDEAVDAKGISLGYDSNDVSEDWELLRGRSGLFNFQKITVDGSDRITEIIEYPAGAVEGDLGRKIAYTYSGGNTKPSTITEIPYTLTGSDLVTP